MRYEGNNINEVLTKHREWLLGHPEGERADLTRANLTGADLRAANLRDATLVGANLRGADLTWANLTCADLRAADLRAANLRDATLVGANLRGADLTWANLVGADLRDADLRDADLRDADLRGANLVGADLRDANVEHIKGIYLNCPEQGEFTAFKKLRDGAIATLLIPSDALRLSATTRKCRASKAIVLRIENQEGEEMAVGVSQYDETFLYEVGKEVSVGGFDFDRWNECSSGIHFFITKQEAIDY